MCGRYDSRFSHRVGRRSVSPSFSSSIAPSNKLRCAMHVRLNCCSHVWCSSVSPVIQDVPGTYHNLVKMAWSPPGLHAPYRCITCIIWCILYVQVGAGLPSRLRTYFVCACIGGAGGWFDCCFFPKPPTSKHGGEGEGGVNGLRCPTLTCGRQTAQPDERVARRQLIEMRGGGGT